jgi:hypothetical protein
MTALTCPGGGRLFWWSAWRWLLELCTSMFWPDHEVFDAPQKDHARRSAVPMSPLVAAFFEPRRRRGDFYHLIRGMKPHDTFEHFRQRAKDEKRFDDLPSTAKCALVGAIFAARVRFKPRHLTSLSVYNEIRVTEFPFGPKTRVWSGEDPDEDQTSNAFVPQVVQFFRVPRQRRQLCCGEVRREHALTQFGRSVPDRARFFLRQQVKGRGS